MGERMESQQLYSYRCEGDMSWSKTPIRANTAPHPRTAQARAATERGCWVGAALRLQLCSGAHSAGMS